jgi:hypothetical protein
MNAPRRRKAPARTALNARSNVTPDFWAATAPAHDEDAGIQRSDEPGTLFRSLGPAPLPGREVIAEHYFATVYDKAASLAAALAAAAGLLRATTDEADDELR